MALSSSWDGSNVHEDHVEFLRRTRRLPGEDRVQVRLASKGEISPAPQEGERVIFRSHCLRGLGLPASRPDPDTATSVKVMSPPPSRFLTVPEVIAILPLAQSVSYLPLQPDTVTL